MPFLLKAITAEQVSQLVRQKRPSSPAAAGGLLPPGMVFVLCTSATAAASSGVGAQCYPGVILDPDATQTTQPELGTVWLTLLDSGTGTVGTPKANQVYICRLAGSVDADSGGSPRPRAFGTLSQPSDSASADCSSWLGRIKDGVCAVLTVTPATTGACACVPSQSTPLSYDKDSGTLTSTTTLYGCPPGIVNSTCLNGAPSKWKAVVSGFTGSAAATINLTWTLTYDSGSATWTQTQGTVTATLDTSGNLTFTDSTLGTLCVYAVSPFACCTDNSLSLSGELDESVLATPPSTISVQVATGCGLGLEWNAILDEYTDEGGVKRQRLRWVSVGTYGGSSSGGSSSGGGHTVTWTPVGCGTDSSGNDYQEFATSDPLICGGKPGDGCANNSVKARVTCGCGSPCPQCPDGVAQTWIANFGGFLPAVVDDADEVQTLSEPSDNSCAFDNWGGNVNALIKMQHDAGLGGWTLTVSDFDGHLATYLISDADFVCCGTNTFSLQSSNFDSAPTTIDVTANQICTDKTPPAECDSGDITLPDTWTLSFALASGTDLLGVDGQSFVLTPTAPVTIPYTLTNDPNADVPGSIFTQTSGNPYGRGAIWAWTGNQVWTAGNVWPPTGTPGFSTYSGVQRRLRGFFVGTHGGQFGAADFVDFSGSAAVIFGMVTETLTAFPNGLTFEPITQDALQDVGIDIAKLCTNTNYPQFTLTSVGPVGTPTSYSGSYNVTISRTTSVSYNCLDSGGCIDPGDGSGRYSTLEECVTACGGGSGGSGSGDCTASTLVGSVATLVVPDGSYAAGGPYTATWSDDCEGGGAYVAEFIMGDGNRFTILCICSGTLKGETWATNNNTATTDKSGATVQGPPVVITFPGTVFGATGDVTVTT